MFDNLLARRGQRATVVGATSGDTGSAAIEACRDRARLDIFILHPRGRVSEVQRRQMTTVPANNVHNIAIMRITPTRFAHEFDHAAVLQAACCAGREHAFDIACASFALCAEAALAPQNTLTHDALRMVISRLHILAFDKRP